MAWVPSWGWLRQRAGRLGDHQRSAVACVDVEGVAFHSEARQYVEEEVHVAVEEEGRILRGLELALALGG